MWRFLVVRIVTTKQIFACLKLHTWKKLETRRLGSLAALCVMYTVRPKSFKTDFIKNRRHEEDTFFFSRCQIYRLLWGRTVSEKLPKILHSWTFFNLLVPELFFLILAHSVYKMWITQEPNTIELWNKLNFEEEINGQYIPCLKYSVPIFVE